MSKEPFRLTEECARRGWWWLPESPGSRVPGLFSFSPTAGIKLDLHGTLDEMDKTGSRCPTILGVVSTGHSVTLRDCFVRNSEVTYAFSGHQQDHCVLRVGKAFVGVHFESVEAATFSALGVQFANLDEWAGRKSLEETREFVQSQLEWHTRRTWYSDDISADYQGVNLSDLVDRYDAVARLKVPKPVQVKVGDCDIAISVQGTASAGSAQISLDQQTWIKFSRKEGKPLDDWLEVLTKMQNFLTLMMSSPTFPVTVRGSTERAKRISKSGAPIYLPVHILYRMPWPHVEPDPLHRRQMLFPLPTIEEDLETYLAEWFRKAERLRPVHNLYFATQYNRSRYAEDRFLDLTQAIESYHRRVFGGDYQTRDEYLKGLYQQFVQVIPADLDPGFKTALKEGKLYYANEYSLRKRLTELARKLSAAHPVFDFVRTANSRDAFVGRVTTIRNHLTHFDPKDDTVVGDGELYHLARKLDATLVALLLHEVGLGLDAIMETMAQSVQYRDLFQSK